MRWSVFLLPFLLLAAFVPGVYAQKDSDLAKALALEKTLQRIIQQHEGSIACILVSRSELHPRNAQNPGQLGDYEPRRLSLPADLSDKERLKWEKKLDLADPTNVPPAFGSGVVVDADGLILTNYHVVQDAAKIYVRLPSGKGSYADIHAADPRSDLAVLKLLQPVGPLRPITFGDAEKLERGQFVLTLANPFAVGFRDGQPSASWGILSNIRRRAWMNYKEEERIKPFHFYGTLLMTDARMNLGCSGGAMFNLQGEMIGLTSSMAGIFGGETPGGFAVPISAPMRRVIDVLKRGEEVDYGFLGVSFEEQHANGQFGVKLSYIGPGGPAALDGKLKDGDTLLAVNGVPINQSDDIYLNVGMHLAGTKVRLHVRSGTKERVADVTLTKLLVPGKKIASSLGPRPYFRGLRVDYTSLVVQQESRLPFIPAGVLITEVQPNSAAERAKLKVGDIITHVNNVPVTTPGGFYQGLNDPRGAVEFTMHGYPAQTPPVRVILQK
jgi:S1-C subfamily serine protease